MRPHALALLLTMLCLPLFAFTPGDVAVAGQGSSSGGVAVFNGAGTFQGHVGSTTPSFNPSSVLFDTTGRLLVARRIGAAGGLATETFTTLTTAGPTLSIDAVAFALDRLGQIYAAPEAGSAVRRYTSTGTLLETFPIPGRAPTSLDLGADQCTLYYGYEMLDETGRIGRYDVCAGLPLSDVPVILPSYSPFGRRALRILPDGTILVVTGSNAQRLTPAGVLVQTYSIPTVTEPWLALALDTTGAQFWVVVSNGGSYNLYRLDVASSSLQLGPITAAPGGQPVSMSVAGEARAAIAGIAAVPVLNTIVLVLLVTCLLSIAITKLA